MIYQRLLFKHYRLSSPEEMVKTGEHCRSCDINTKKCWESKSLPACYEYTEKDVYLRTYIFKINFKSV